MIIFFFFANCSEKLIKNKPNARTNSSIFFSENDSPPASPPPLRVGRRRGSLPIMHLGGTGSLVAPLTSGRRLPPLELIQEVERRGSREETGDAEADGKSHGGSNTGSESGSGSGPRCENEAPLRPDPVSKTHPGNSKQFPRRSSLIVLDPLPERPRSADSSGKGQGHVSSQTPSRAKTQSSNFNAHAPRSSAQKQRSRSHSLSEPKSVRLTRGRRGAGAGATPPGAGAGAAGDLGEQFARLQDCRYLRSGPAAASEDCDLSNVFG